MADFPQRELTYPADWWRTKVAIDYSFGSVRDVRGVLDDERLNGPHSSAIRLRPPRTARTVKHDDYQRLIDNIELACQIWGGASHPLIPLDDDLRVSSLYRDIVLGSSVDAIEGLAYRGSVAEPLDYGARPGVRPGDEFAVLATIGTEGRARPKVVAPQLSTDDPWHGIYAACLGLLPSEPSGDMIRVGRYVHDFHFAQHLTVDRPEVVGSAADLLARMQEWDVWSPRQSTLVELASGLVPNTGIRAGTSRGQDLPGGRFEASDAGPNIVVVCSANNVGDLALLWNLRATHSDRYVAPIGLPLALFDPSFLTRLMEAEMFCRQGMPHRSLYLTSTSVTVEELRHLVPETSRYESIGIAAPDRLVNLGPAPARHRTEVLTWNDGLASLVPLTPSDRNDLRHLLDTNLGHRMVVDLSVGGHEFPSVPDLRVGGMNQKFFAGTSTMSASGSRPVQDVAWPSSLLMARSICSHRGIELSVSAPGRAALTFLESIGGIVGLHRLAHAPILGVLEAMAQRQGTAWAKAHLRKGSPSIEPAVAPVEDDLPEVTFDVFRAALGNTTGARKWLEWAETSKVIVKGFPIQCETCEAAQWLPVSGFAPPIICRGCGRTIERPFRRESLTFKYRLGEAARRVWEEDAVGHLLVLRYYDALFGKSMVGSHPGMNVSRRGATVRLGEADCLALFRNGAFVVTEVKRSFAGVTDDEVAKLDTLVEAFRSPWSAIAVPRYFESDGEAEFVGRQIRSGDGPHRVLLTYDHLLEMNPMHPLGGPHPTIWAPITGEERAVREERFVRNLEGENGWFDPLEWDMMARMDDGAGAG